MFCVFVVAFAIGKPRSPRLLGLAPVFSVYGRTGRPAPAARFIPYPLRNVGGTFYVRYGTNQTVSVPKQLGGRGGAATRPDRAVHSCTCSAVGTDGPRTCRFWYLLDRWGDEQHHT